MLSCADSEAPRGDDRVGWALAALSENLRQLERLHRTAFGAEKPGVDSHVTPPPPHGGPSSAIAAIQGLRTARKDHAAWATGAEPADAQFSRFPPADDWRPGDLLPFSATEPPYVSRRIVAAQELGGYSPEDARWHHAAVYVGGLRICEARWNGVRAGSIYDYIGTHRIRVRRDPTLSLTDGYQIALQAFLRMRWYYSVWTIARLLLQSYKGFYEEPVGLRFASRHSLICSMLYADAYTLVTRRILGNAAGETPTPAFLSATTALEDVGGGWLGIE